MKALILIFSILVSLGLHAQIGYQVAVLNSATGTPRANENVSVAVTITDSDDATLYKQTQSVMTNEFGIASLTVGNADTFSAVDWSKLPFFISATVDGKMIGKTQILSVPVAEYAKQSGPVLTKEMLLGTWKYVENVSFYDRFYTLLFSNDGTCLYTEECIVNNGNPNLSNYINKYNYKYIIDGTRIFLLGDVNSHGYQGSGTTLFYLKETGQIYDIFIGCYNKQ